MFKGRKSGREISAPRSVTHGVHVDKDFEWSGPDAATQFVFGEKLGEGSFGAVFRASHKNSGIEMAIKSIPVLDNDDLGDIKHEIDILKVCFRCWKKNNTHERNTLHSFHDFTTRPTL